MKQAGSLEVRRIQDDTGPSLRCAYFAEIARVHDRRAADVVAWNRRDLRYLHRGVFRVAASASVPRPRATLGKTVQLDGANFTIAGVMPPGFDFPAGSDLWIPAAPDPGNHHMVSLQVIGRTKPGVAPAQADAELSAISSRFDWGGPRTARLISLHESIVGNVRKSLQIFLGAVGFLLLIACVNVANLVVA